MGDRANVVLYEKLPRRTATNPNDKEVFNYSPVIYTHWGGGNVGNVIQEIYNLYKNDTSDTSFEVSMRLEVERVFPNLLTSFIKNGMQPCVYNWNSDDFKYKLPTANDMPIIADDRGTYFVNIYTWHVTNSNYDYAPVLEELSKKLEVE